MSVTDLLSVTDCATLVHVSEETIREYARLGFLTPEGEGDQMRFKEQELRSIFGAELREAEPSRSGELPSSAVDVPQPFLREQIEVSKAASSQGAEGEASGETFVQRFRRMRADASANTAPSAAEQWGTFEIRGRTEREAASRDERLLTVVNSQLNEEVRMLRDERDWLRQRLEKLEARSERDQMLLLSESENVRGLVDMHQNRKPFWLRALPWLKNPENNDA